MLPAPYDAAGTSRNEVLHEIPVGQRAAGRIRRSKAACRDLRSLNNVRERGSGHCPARTCGSIHRNRAGCPVLENVARHRDVAAADVEAVTGYAAGGIEDIPRNRHQPRVATRLTGEIRADACHEICVEY